MTNWTYPLSLVIRIFTMDAMHGQDLKRGVTFIWLWLTDRCHLWFGLKSMDVKYGRNITMHPKYHKLRLTEGRPISLELHDGCNIWIGLTDSCHICFGLIKGCHRWLGLIDGWHLLRTVLYMADGNTNRSFSLLVYYNVTNVDYIEWDVMFSTFYMGPSWSWSYGSWIYSYPYIQCLSPLKLWVRIPLR
jgi:hypothetical protein